MMIKSMRMTLLLMSCLLAGLANGQSIQTTQSCHSLLDATTPTSRYDFSIASGVVVDAQLNLMWQRCPLGYQLDDGGTADFLEDDRCEVASVTEFFWADALLATESHNSAPGLGGFTNWRLPNSHELATVIERQCHHPALNLSVFPNTGDFLLLGNFWSATPLLEQGSAFVGPRARGWNFRFGETFRSPINPVGPFGTEANAVRLVRDL